MFELEDPYIFRWAVTGDLVAGEFWRWGGPRRPGAPLAGKPTGGQVHWTGVVCRALTTEIRQLGKRRFAFTRRKTTLRGGRADALGASAKVRIAKDTSGAWMGRCDG